MRLLMEYDTVEYGSHHRYHESRFRRETRDRVFIARSFHYWIHSVLCRLGSSRGRPGVTTRRPGSDQGATRRGARLASVP